MYSVATQLISKKIIACYNNWVFNVFCLSTLFILIFSVKAIQSWPPLIGKVVILLACILPATMIAFVQVPVYFRKKKVPKEILWLFLIFILGLTCSLLSETPWISLKSTGLFIASGPFIFITTSHLFKSTRNQILFLWMISLAILYFGVFYLFFNFNNSLGMMITDGENHNFHIPNPLPVGASLILLSAGPMILLTRKSSPASRLILVFGLIVSVTAIILLAKKGPILGLIVIVLFGVVFINLRYLKFLLGFVLLIGCLLYFSESTLSKYKSTINLNSSVTLRAELIFFGAHIFKENPAWGLGSKADLSLYLKNHKIIFKNLIPADINYIEDRMSIENYLQQHLRKFKTFENIFLAFLIEMGGLFSITYFGGLLYIIVRCFKNSSPLYKDIEMLSLVSVIAGFLFISCTFDTLRFPNLNWLFHSLLGLMINLPQKSIGCGPEAN
jgi:hypothetical protein